MTNSEARATNPLSPAHAALLAESCISPEVAAERGYRTITTADEAAEIGFTEPYQQRIPALAIPIRNVKGEVAMHRIRPDVPRLQDQKQVKYETPKGATICLDVPKRSLPLIGDAKVPLYFTEGEKKADCLASLGHCAIGLCGVWGWKRKGNPLEDFDAIALFGRQGFIVFDSDIRTNRKVYQAAVAFAAELTSRGAKTTILEVPSARDGSKNGIDDYVFAGGKIEDLRDIRAASPKDRHVEVVDPARLSEQIDIAEAALAADPDVFIHNNRMVRIVRRDNVHPELARVRFEPIAKPTAVELIARHVDWMKVSRGNAIPIITPKEVVDGLFARGTWPRVRHVTRLVTHPFATRDGEIILENGYHPRLGIYVDSDIAIEPIPDSIPTALVMESMDLLRLPTASVQFQDVESRDVPVLMLLTTLDLPNGAKPPCFFVTAPFPKSGKTFIAHLGHEVAYGRTAATATLSNSSEEVRKTLTTFVRECRPVVVLDNISNGQYVVSPDLDQLLTSKVRLDRQLGTNESIEAVSNVLVILTGNNITAGEDTIRRIVHCRINRPYPQRRQDDPLYASDPLAEIRANRGVLLRAALIILAAFHRLQSSERPGGFVIPSFEDWSCGTLHPFLAAGGNFDRGSAEGLADVDDWSSEAIGAVIRMAISQGRREGFTTSDVMKWSDSNGDLKQCLDSAVDDGPANAKKVGRFISRMRDRPIQIDETYVSIDARKKATGNNSRAWFLKFEAIDTPPRYPNVDQSSDSRVSGFPGFKTEFPRTGDEQDSPHASAHVRTCEGQAENKPGKPGNPAQGEPPTTEQAPRHEPPTTDDDEVIELERGIL